MSKWLKISEITESGTYAMSRTDDIPCAQTLVHIVYNSHQDGKHYQSIPPKDNTANRKGYVRWDDPMDNWDEECRYFHIPEGDWI